MNIYLDIDGVLLANESYATPHAEEFLRALLTKYPDTVYWLTTHCWRGVNRTREALAPAFNNEVLELIKQVKPTDWGDAKTDAIDFSKPFLWFDDDLYDIENKALVEHNVLNSRVEVDIVNNPSQLKELAEWINS